VKQNHIILLKLSKTKQWNYWLLQWSTVWHCFRGLNRPFFVTVTIEGEARKLNPAKQSLFQHAPLSLSLPKKKQNINRPRPPFANLWLLLVYIKWSNHMVAMRSKEVWLVQESYATVKLDSSFASRRTRRSLDLNNTLLQNNAYTITYSYIKKNLL